MSKKIVKKFPVVLDHIFVQAPTLDVFQFRILVFLKSFNPCFPSIDRICRGTKISRNKVCSTIKTLKALGYITYEKGGRDHSSNRYEVSLTPRQSSTETSTAKKTRRQSSTDTQTSTPQGLQLVPGKDSKLSNLNKSKLKGSQDNRQSPQSPIGRVGTPMGIGREKVEAKGRRATQKQISAVLGPLLNPYRYQRE